jgi:hypothetical protein
VLGYSPEEVSKVPIASLRNARLSTVSAAGTPHGSSAQVNFVLYLAVFALIFVVQPTAWMLVAALTLAVAALVIIVTGVVMLGLYQPMQIVAIDESRVIALLKGAVPVLAGVATLVVTVLKLAGGS